MKLYASFLFLFLGAIVVGCSSNEPTVATEGMSESDFADYEAALEEASGGMEEDETADIE